MIIVIYPQKSVYLHKEINIENRHGTKNYHTITEVER